MTKFWPCLRGYQKLSFDLQQLIQTTSQNSPAHLSELQIQFHIGMLFAKPRVAFNVGHGDKNDMTHHISFQQSGHIVEAQRGRPFILFITQPQTDKHSNGWT